jgi:hypothetical protein
MLHEISFLFLWPARTRATNARSQAAALIARMPRSSSPVRATRASFAAIMSVLAASMRRASHLRAHT